MHKTLPIMFAAGAVAQSTMTTSWLAGGFDNTPVASVIAADSKAVTYSIACNDSDIQEGECGIPAGFTVTAGPSIFEYHYTDYTVATDYTVDFTMDASCAIEGTTKAVCVESADGSDANFPGLSTETLTGTDVEWGPLVITAGAEKLSATAGATATGSSSASETSASAQSGSRTSAGVSATGSSTAASTSASQSSSASGSAAQASSTGGAAHFAVPVAGVAGALVAALAL